MRTASEALALPAGTAPGKAYWCSWCGLRPWTLKRSGLTAEECRALATQSGLTGEVVDGQPVVAAVLIRRRERTRFTPMPREAWCDTDWPMFCCPWSRFPRNRRSILHHGPAYRAASGEAQPFELAADGSFALDHRVSHCPVAPGGGYCLRYVLVPELPRRMVDPWTGRLGEWREVTCRVQCPRDDRRRNRFRCRKSRRPRSPSRAGGAVASGRPPVRCGVGGAKPAPHRPPTGQLQGQPHKRTVGRLRDRRNRR